MPKGVLPDASDRKFGLLQPFVIVIVLHGLGSELILSWDTGMKGVNQLNLDQATGMVL